MESVVIMMTLPATQCFLHTKKPGGRHVTTDMNQTHDSQAVRPLKEKVLFAVHRSFPEPTALVSQKRVQKFWSGNVKGRDPLEDSIHMDMGTG
jgi:hypothetical protein